MEEEEETEKIVESFYNYQKQEKGLSEETASAHAHHIRFFALHYLLGYAGKTLFAVTDRDIDDYLGNWYIRKVWGGGKSEVRPILTAFKKFYKFLHERGSVDKDQLDEIISACKNPRRYIRRFESYDELDPDSDTRDIDYEGWFMDEYDEEELEVNYEQPFEVNEKISTAFSKDDLFDALWNETRWGKILPPDSEGSPESVKVFEARIVPALTIFGLLDFGFEKDRKEYLVNHGLGIEWFTITKLGQKIFRGIGTV